MVTGFVLAGGKSSRMGEDKSMMIWKGKRLIEYAIEALKPLCNKVIISSNVNQYQFTGCETWPDLLPQQAPMIGIYSSLKYSDTEDNLILSCDMPLITSRLFEYLLSNSASHDVIIPVHDYNKIETLCGVFKKNIIASLERSIRDQNFSLYKFIDSTSHLKLEIGQDHEFFHNDLFLNVNTVEDFSSLR
jgi:molybdopterin-guanine dinucleotide biosynthesis protein A